MRRGSGRTVGCLGRRARLRLRVDARRRVADAACRAAVWVDLLPAQLVSIGSSSERKQERKRKGDAQTVLAQRLEQALHLLAHVRRVARLHGAVVPVRRRRPCRVVRRRGGEVERRGRDVERLALQAR